MKNTTALSEYYNACKWNYTEGSLFHMKKKNVKKMEMYMTNHCAKIKYVYIMGPITPRGMRKDTNNAAIEYLFNVGDMIQMGIALMEYGFVPFTPGIDFPYFLTPASKHLSEEMIYRQSIAWMGKCDALLALPGSFDKRSKGCKAEIKLANKLCIPIFRNFQELLDAAK